MTSITRICELELALLTQSATSRPTWHGSAGVWKLIKTP